MFSVAPLAETITDPEHELMRTVYLNRLAESDDASIQSFVRVSSGGLISTDKKKLVKYIFLPLTNSSTIHDPILSDNQINTWIIDEINTTGQKKLEFYDALLDTPEIYSIRSAILEVLRPKPVPRSNHLYEYPRAIIQTDMDLTSRGLNPEDLQRSYDGSKAIYTKQLARILQQSDPLGISKDVFEKERIKIQLESIINRELTSAIRDIVKINPNIYLCKVDDYDGEPVKRLTESDQFQVFYEQFEAEHFKELRFIIDNEEYYYNGDGETFGEDPLFRHSPTNNFTRLLQGAGKISEDYEDTNCFLEIQMRVRLLHLADRIIEKLDDFDSYEDLDRYITERNKSYSIVEQLTNNEALLGSMIHGVIYPISRITENAIEDYITTRIITSPDKRFSYYFGNEKPNLLNRILNELDLLKTIRLSLRDLPDTLSYALLANPAIVPFMLFLLMKRVNIFDVKGNIYNLLKSDSLSTFPQIEGLNFQPYSPPTRENRSGSILTTNSIIPMEVGSDGNDNYARVYLPQFAELQSLELTLPDGGIVDPNEYTTEYDANNGFYRIKILNSMIDKIKYKAHYKLADVIYDKSIPLNAVKLEEQLPRLKELGYDRTVENIETYLSNHRDIDSLALSEIVRQSFLYTFLNKGIPEEVQCTGASEFTAKLLNDCLQDDATVRFYQSSIHTLSLSKSIPTKKFASMVGHSDSRASYIDADGRPHIIIHDSTPTKKAESRRELLQSAEIDLQTMQGNFEIEFAELFNNNMELWKNMISNIMGYEYAIRPIYHELEAIEDEYIDTEPNSSILPKTRRIQPIGRALNILDTLIHGYETSGEVIFRDTSMMRTILSQLDYLLEVDGHNYKSYSIEKRNSGYKDQKLDEYFGDDAYFLSTYSLAKRIREFIHQYAVTEEFEEFISEETEE